VVDNSDGCSGSGLLLLLLLLLAVVQCCKLFTSAYPTAEQLQIHGATLLMLHAIRMTLQ
jgi:hypothetical protein